MTKHFCDRCRQEISRDGVRVVIEQSVLELCWQCAEIVRKAATTL